MTSECHCQSTNKAIIYTIGITKCRTKSGSRPPPQDGTAAVKSGPQWPVAVRELFSVTRFSKIKVRLFRNVTQQTMTGAAGQVQMGMAAFGVRPLIDLIYTLRNGAQPKHKINV